MQLEEAQAIWERALSHEPHTYPFLTHAWHAAWQKFGDPAQRLTVYTDGEVLISLIRIGTEAHFSGGEEVADYLDAIGERDNKEEFWKQLLPFLKTQGFNRLVLRNVPFDSPTKGIFESLGGKAVEEDSTPILHLPSSHDEYVAGLERKDRHELQRKIRKFERSYPNLQFEMKERESIDMDALLELMKKDSDKKIFLTHPMESFFRALPLLPNIPIIQANLRANGAIIASVLLFPVGSSLLLYNSGYDPAFQGSGFYLKAQTILWAIDHHVTEYNFLQGKERYKYELGAKDQPVFKIEV